MICPSASARRCPVERGSGEPSGRGTGRHSGSSAACNSSPVNTSTPIVEVTRPSSAMVSDVSLRAAFSATGIRSGSAATASVARPIVSRRAATATSAGVSYRTSLRASRCRSASSRVTRLAIVLMPLPTASASSAESDPSYRGRSPPGLQHVARCGRCGVRPQEAPRSQSTVRPRNERVVGMEVRRPRPPERVPTVRRPGHCALARSRRSPT